MRNALVFMALMFGLADVGNASYELRLDCSGKDHEGKKYTLEGSYIVAMQPGANTVEIGNWIKLNGSVRRLKRWLSANGLISISLRAKTSL